MIGCRSDHFFFLVIGWGKYFWGKNTVQSFFVILRTRLTVHWSGSTLRSRLCLPSVFRLTIVVWEHGRATLPPRPFLAPSSKIFWWAESLISPLQRCHRFGPQVYQFDPLFRCWYFVYESKVLYFLGCSLKSVRGFSSNSGKRITPVVCGGCILISKKINKKRKKSVHLYWGSQVPIFPGKFAVYILNIIIKYFIFLINDLLNIYKLYFLFFPQTGF